MNTNTATADNTATTTRRPGTSVAWEKIPSQPRTYGCIRRVTTRNTYTNQERTYTVALRIDGRLGEYRVDSCTVAPLWEAIDGGKGFPTVAAAKRFATAWIRECFHQGTLHPHDIAALR